MYLGIIDPCEGNLEAAQNTTTHPLVQLVGRSMEDVPNGFFSPVGMRLDQRHDQVEVKLPRRTLDVEKHEDSFLGHAKLLQLLCVVTGEQVGTWTVALTTS